MSCIDVNEPSSWAICKEGTQKNKIQSIVHQ